MKPINDYKICKVIGITYGRDNDKEQRSLTVQSNKGKQPRIFKRNMNRFSLLEIDDVTVEKQIDYDPTQDNATSMEGILLCTHITKECRCANSTNNLKVHENCTHLKHCL